MANGSFPPVADIRRVRQVHNMPDLLHEYWKGDVGGEFGPVREFNDAHRPTRLANARWFSAYMRRPGSKRCGVTMSG